MNAIAIVVVLAASSAAGMQVLNVYPADEPSVMEQGKDVQVNLDKEITTDNAGSLRVTFSGEAPADAMLFSEAITGVDDTVLWYEADIRCGSPGGAAYLALWVVMPDGNRYFSRGIDQPCGKDWRRSRIPFRLEKGHRPERIEMGVRFEGPGTVWVDNARLLKGGPPVASDRWGGWLGAAIGIFGGLWGAVTGLCAPRGKAKKLVVGLGLVFILIEVSLLAAGLVLLATGRPFQLWYPLVVGGGIGVIIFPPLLAVVMKRYRDFEAQRLNAKDASDSL